MIVQTKPSRGGTSVLIKCDFCGFEKWTRSRVLTRLYHFCSQQCAYDSPERREKISERMTGSGNPQFGIPHTIEHNLMMSQKFSGSGNPFYGKKHTLESRLKSSVANSGTNSHRSGKVHPWWKPWMTSEKKKWATRIRQLYDHMCAVCSSSKQLHSHHIVPQSFDPSLTLDMNNGICLCRRCHNDVHKLLKKSPKEYETFMKSHKREHNE